MPFAHNGDVSLYYETFGDPTDPALLLVNGLGSQSINFRTEWCAKFAAAGFHVIRFDNRDVGLSTKFDDVEPDLASVVDALRAQREPVLPYRLDDMAADAMAVLDAVGVERAHIFGVSMGGMIVQKIAITCPERVLTMTSAMSRTGDYDVGQSAPGAQALLFAPPPTTRAEYIARQQASSQMWGSPAEYDADRVAQYAGEAYDRGFNPDGQARQAMAIVADGSRTAALGDVDLPALVIHGDADKLVDQSGGRRTAEAIPGARFVLLEGLGHDYPPAFWDTFVSLVSEHALART